MEGTADHHKTYVENVNFGEIGDRVPLAANILQRADEYDWAQLFDSQIRRAQRHHEVHEAEARRIIVCQNAHYDMPAEVHSTRFLTIL